MDTKVSVIVPVYNSEETLEKCLKSLLNQTFKEFEVIAINDGSKDLSWNILKIWAEKDARLRVVNQDNQGVAKTRNLGITLARSEYLMFVDNDDYVDENYIETFYNEAISDYHDIVIGGYQRVNTKGKILHREVLRETEWSKYIVVAPWARIYRKKFLLENDINFFDYGIGEDVVFNLIAYSKTQKIKTIPYVGYYWYYNEDSVSNTNQRGLSKDLDIKIVLQEIMTHCGQMDHARLNYYLYRYLAWYMLFSGRYASPRVFMAEFLRSKHFLDETNTYKPALFSPLILGESLRNRIIVALFYSIYRLRLLPLFSKIYCRG
ncbi:glycosyltransferase family 2 protein [Streptococcus plurextorum]|uniref:glycosyltransferase family 2 protein n=1 Tax=Streptococcus plurextorum TaxID=456876 RepID=UPI0004051FC4|nr:glycosyltransferase family 2 protein [Streptococcus plurextorum]